MQNLCNRLYIYVYSGYHICNIYLFHIIYVNFIYTKSSKCVHICKIHYVHRHETYYIDFLIKNQQRYIYKLSLDFIYIYLYIKYNNTIKFNIIFTMV